MARTAAGAPSAISVPAVQHEHAVGVTEHHVHVVLGKEDADRAFARDAGGEAHQRVALARRHAGRRLVHQQKLWVVGERDGEFEPLEIAVGELTAAALRLVSHSDEIEQSLRLGDMVAGRPAERRPAGADDAR